MERNVNVRGSRRVSHQASGTYALEEAPEEPVYVEKPELAMPENRPIGLGEYVDGFSATGLWALNDLVVAVEPLAKLCINWARQQADETKEHDSVHTINLGWFSGVVAHCSY